MKWATRLKEVLEAPRVSPPPPVQALQEEAGHLPRRQANWLEDTEQGHLGRHKPRLPWLSLR